LVCFLTLESPRLSAFARRCGKKRHYATLGGLIELAAATEVVMTVLTLTGTVTVNAAFLQEIKEVNQELWQVLGDLRHRFQRPIAPGQCRLLMDRLCLLRDQLALHFSLEEAYGYFDDPIDAAPQLTRAAEQLRGEHKELFLELCELVDHAERMFYEERHAALALWLGPEFLGFDRRLRTHEEREIELIYEAYEADIGVGD
jgi:hypothetical protein